MNCQDFHDLIALYHYGELAAEDEERLEHHVDGCAVCRAEEGRMRAIAQALDARAMAPEAPLVAECRRDLMDAVLASRPPALGWDRLRSVFPSFANPVAGLRQLAFAAGLVGLGFLAARIPFHSSIRGGRAVLPESTNVIGSSIVPPPGETFSNVRSVQPDPASGRVQIGLEETRRHFVSGSLADAAIQKLLLTAAGDETNPGLRVESIGILKDYPGSREVRQALLEALKHDPNPSVRLKAIEGLKSFAAQADIRQALARALVSDTNQGVRVQVIEVLTEHPDDSLVGVFQNLVHLEHNNYVRLRCQEALRHMNASEGTF